MRLFVLGLAILAGAVRADAPAAPPHARVARIYQTRCESCHGIRGDGNGPASHFLTPRPRDFAEGDFKLRSTESGDIPTDEDLERTIRRGIPGTAMPAFQGQLSDEEVRAVITVLKSYSPRFDMDGPGMPLSLPPEPPADDRAVARGQAVYARQACARCHGADGRGAGPEAAKVRDAARDPLRPRDLTSRASYKGGATPAEIFRTLSTGMDGTPMVALRGRIADRELWDLAYYLRSLTK